MAPAASAALGLGRDTGMFKWVIGFVMLAIVAAICGFAFAIPAAQTLALVSGILAGLLLAGSVFEGAASA